MDPFVPTPEELNQMFAAMGDSVWLIDNHISNGPCPDQTQAECNVEVTLNVAHLELMLSKPYIQDAGRDLSPYEAAVVDGKAYVDTHPAKSGEAMAA